MDRSYEQHKTSTSSAWKFDLVKLQTRDLKQRDLAAHVERGENKGEYPYNPMLEASVDEDGKHTERIERMQETPKTDLVQSSKTSKQHSTGWDDEIFDFPGPIPDDDTSRLFLRNIQQIKDKTIDDLIALIPEYAIGREFIDGRLQGFEYTWTDPQLRMWSVQAHSPNRTPEIPKDANISKGWTVRVKRDCQYMDLSGNFHDAKVTQNWRFINVDMGLLEKTHIPIQSPNPYRSPVLDPDQRFKWGQAQLERIARHSQFRLNLNWEASHKHHSDTKPR